MVAPPSLPGAAREESLDCGATGADLQGYGAPSNRNTPEGAAEIQGGGKRASGGVAHSSSCPSITSPHGISSFPTSSATASAAVSSSQASSSAAASSASSGPPGQPCNFSNVESYLKEQDGYYDQIVHVQRYSGKPASFGQTARRQHP